MTSGYVSPIFAAQLDGKVPRDLIGQPVVTCSHCKFSLLKQDLAAMDLIARRFIQSLHGKIGVSLDFWPCLSCGASLYSSEFFLYNTINEALKSRLMAAIHGIHAQLLIENVRWSIPRFLSEIEGLVAKAELVQNMGPHFNQER